MKKLIAISVVFALAAGVAFAVDLGGDVIMSVNVIDADSGGAVRGSAEVKRIRIEGGGEVADGKFGGWLRFGAGELAGIAWWKPIDQLKLGLGGNPDGIWGKEGNSGWMFYQGASDTQVVSPSNCWGGAYAAWPNRMRAAFYQGFGDNRLFIEISPVDMVSINIGIPFFQSKVLRTRTSDGHVGDPVEGGYDIGDVFKSTDAQIALNLSFGSFAFTYNGNSDIKQSKMFGYFCLTAIDNLSIDFGLGAEFNNNNPLSLGLAVKYGTDSWGIKFRSLFNIPLGKEDADGNPKPFGLLFDVLPYFVVNENFRVYVSGGVNFGDVKDIKNATTTWHVNPYIEIGEEWGPRFFAGIKVYQRINNKPWDDDMDSLVHFAVPIAIAVSF